VPSGEWLDQQDAQLRRRGIQCHTEHTAGPTPVELGDPPGFSCRVVALGEVCHDSGDHRLEVAIPAVLAGVGLTVRLDDPAQVPGLTNRRMTPPYQPPRLLKQSFQ